MGGFHHGSRDNDDSVLLAGGGYKSVSDFTTTASDVYWKDVKDKIRHSNEFNIVPSGYNSTMWFNYRSDADTNVTVSEYIFGNGSHSASAAIKSGTVYPGSNASYDIGKTGSRWAWGYFNSGILIGSTSYTGPRTNAAGTTVASGYIEMNATDPYIDFHRSGYFTSDYSSRLIHWNNRDRLSYECYSSTYSGYVATCEGNPNNLVIIGVFDLYKTNDSTQTWSISTICGPCSFSLQQSNSNSDIYYKSRTSSAQSWTISGNVLRVYVNGPSSNAYAWKSTPYAVSCDARVMTRWINHQPVVTNCMHSAWVGSSIECLCTNLSNGSSLYYYSSSPGRYIYITGSRPWGYDNGSNGMGMDMMRVTGDESYQRIRFTVFGYLS